MLLNLDDLCLHEICNNLNLQEHLVLSQVCEQLENFIQNRFETAQKLLKNVESKRSTTRTPHWMLVETIPKNCPRLLRTLKYESLGEINCEASQFLRMKDSLTSLKFLNINSLKVGGSEFKTTKESDEFEELVTSLFPRLEKFQCSISFSGKYVAKLDRLVELDMDISKINEDFIESFKDMQLKRLSIIKPLVDWQNLAKIEMFSKLEELKICEQDYEKLTELSDFKLPQSLTKLIVVAATDETEMKLDEDLACYAHIDSVNVRLCIALQEYSNESVKHIIGKLRHFALSDDDIDSLKKLYKTFPKDWKLFERTFYFNEMRDANDSSLQEKMLGMVNPIFQDNDFLGLNPKQRVAIIILSQTRPKRLFMRYRNILSEHFDVINRK